MNAEQLLAHYERVADISDAIPRLRGFVLDLAVRGKLVPQFEDDEPASALLQRIAHEKARRLKIGEVRQPRALPPSDEPPCELPETWRWSCIAEIGFISPRVDAEDDVLASFVPMPLIAADVGVAHQHEQRKWGEIKKGYTHFADGDVGLAKITPCFENGKSAVFRNLTGGFGSGTTELHVVRPVLVVPDYVLLFFKSSHFIETGIPRMTGTAGQKRVPADYFAYSPFPLPPLAEQHRIVSKVDELMALCDRLEAARAQREATRDRLTASTLGRLNTPEPPASPDGDASKESSFQSDARFALKVLPSLSARPDQIKQLRQTILNLAVQGKLVSQVSRDGRAGPLLARLKAAKQLAHEAEELRARIPPRSPTRSDLNFDFPAAWDVAAFDDLFVIVSGVTKGQKIPASESIEAPYLRVANVQRGYLDLDVIKTISVRASDIQRYALRAGDILMTEGGDWDKLGRAAVWRDEVPGCIHQNHVFRVRPPSSDIVPEWVTTYVNSPLGRAFFEDASKQTTNLASINMTQLRSCPIPLPPTAEQHRIVAKVDELMSLCDQLEASLTRGENTRSRLLNALLHEALQPGHDNVIDFETARQRLLEKRQAVACRIVERLSLTKGFGRVRAVKPLYFAEAHCGVALGGRWGRGEFGPYDHWIRSFESQAAGAGWLTFVERQATDGNTRVEYTAGPQLSSKAQTATPALGDGAAEFERVLTLLAGLDTSESEIVATLYAAWNDLMIETKPVSDDLVISEFREHWGAARKANFDAPRLRKWLDWMRKNQLTPKGQGPSTRHQPELI